ncbi:hypothetical protein M231_04580 [Tremella mesenterica]|uniref:DNA-directed RNA polymerase III subunit RPC3 n=1 Tax=Tremella mesenterica TaxID=5217 RepID=A0A4Q1BK43_TREME|nr:hypothetical protein M231_04580 [Tremella mesenterica]
MSASSKEAVRLCQHLVRQAFGTVVSRIASTLMNRGRLTCPTLARLSALSRSTTMAALLILMQHHLVQSSGEPPDSDKEEAYEFNMDECLLRLRWGRILAMTLDKLGPSATEVIRSLMLYGRLAKDEIIHACGGGHGASNIMAIEEATLLLVRHHFIQPTHPEMGIIRADAEERRFLAHRRRLYSTKGLAYTTANDLANARSQAGWEESERRAALVSSNNIIVLPEPHPMKKRKLVEPELSLCPNIALRINYDRYGVLIRDELIVRAVRDRLNVGAAEVMRAVLTSCLNDESALADPRTLVHVSANDVIDKIPEQACPFIFAGMAGSSKSSLADVVKQYLRVLSGEDQVASGGSFLSTEGTSLNPMYKVELEGICSKLRAALMNELVVQKLGDEGARVLAVVVTANKVSETTVRDCAMIPLRSARFYLSELQKLSLVETQEMPRVMGKGAMSKDAHLWSIDLARAYTYILSSVYKTLGNIELRKQTEVDRKKVVLAKEAKAGAAGRERLQLKDQQDLAELDDTLKKLTLAEGRSEEVVLILRDLPGWPGR